MIDGGVLNGSNAGKEVRGQRGCWFQRRCWHWSWGVGCNVGGVVLNGSNVGKEGVKGSSKSGISCVDAAKCSVDSSSWCCSSASTSSIDLDVRAAVSWR